ncbi:TadE family protein [Arthrobacter agilis]|uniref:TadE family type IV pilus minor pilin n=1 Tax=Arthrobacter agilis TaxID=37921 RepID=UPI000B35F492|nr:TadE family type IV pilus minor pilin [Arthrobacter agilis]OUM43020.1 hypothetical protein B8W74_07155 [Arthrobacter agilis]PPB45965.1 TadE family protein [Arthrobacter agilis]TPV25505.1 TadE family protein [Arthrobacter agilis]VDR33252.1 Uncharacterised protein [Arthrobacter agilis]
MGSHQGGLIDHTASRVGHVPSPRSDTGALGAIGDSGAAGRQDGSRSRSTRWPVRRGGPSGQGSVSDRGSVTAEVAVVLPALVVLVALILGMAQVGVVQLRIEEAARAGAREVMRGESSTTVQQTVRRLAGRDAVTSTSSDGGWTTVVVRARVTGPVVGIFGVELVASAAGREESDG